MKVDASKCHKQDLKNKLCLPQTNVFVPVVDQPMPSLSETYSYCSGRPLAADLIRAETPLIQMPLLMSSSRLHRQL